MNRPTLTAIVVAVICLLTSAGLAKKKRPIDKVDTDELIKNTQAKVPSGDRHVSIIWWIPAEFWEATFAKDQNLSEAGKKGMIAALKPYTLLAVLQADISDFGAFAFYNKGEVEKGLKIRVKPAEGEPREITLSRSASRDVNMLLSVMKPILTAAMGKMGENFHFFVLDDAGADGKRKIDPYGPGTLDVRLARRHAERISGQLELPLDALYVPRKCPNGKDAHVSWKYCPWTGKKLPD